MQRSAVGQFDVLVIGAGFGGPAFGPAAELEAHFACTAPHRLE